MPPRSSHAEADLSPVGLVHPLHAGRYSLLGGTARPPGTASASAQPTERPTHPSDVAQSRLFGKILLDELDELGELVAAAERRWRRQREDGSAVVPHELLRLRERVKEARRLLDALHERFPVD